MLERHGYECTRTRPLLWQVLLALTACPAVRTFDVKDCCLVSDETTAAVERHCQGATARLEQQPLLASPPLPTVSPAGGTDGSGRARREGHSSGEALPPRSNLPHAGECKAQGLGMNERWEGGRGEKRRCGKSVER